MCWSRRCNRSKAIAVTRSSEELTVDYHFAKDVERVPCACGAEKCRGTMFSEDEVKRRVRKAKRAAGKSSKA